LFTNARTGYTAGGLANDLISISAPFEITFGLLVVSTLYTALLLPYIPPASHKTGTTSADSIPPTDSGSTSKKPESLFAFLACLTVFVPTRYAHRTGRFWGLTLLGLGAFGGTLATAYVVSWNS
jgi:hypothetical protein